MDVLLIDDDDLIRVCLVEALHEAGLATVEQSSGEDALRAIVAQGPPRIVVTDINLGAGMDGRVFAAELRRQHPGVPVIYISGRYAEIKPLSATERFLPKPFTTRTLLDVIDELRGEIASVA
ncbi:MAG: response regulator [Janthinobacterium lividum]